MTDADLLWEKITSGWLMASADLLWEKNTINWQRAEQSESYGALISYVMHVQLALLSLFVVDAIIKEASWLLLHEVERGGCG